MYTNFCVCECEYNCSTRRFVHGSRITESMTINIANIAKLPSKIS